MTLALVPMPPPPPAEGTAEFEDAVRDRLRSALGLTATVHAPSWTQVMFMGRPIAIKVPSVPDGVSERLRKLTPEAFGPDPIGLQAMSIAETLQHDEPKGRSRRSIAPGKALPVVRGARDSWTRGVMLAACGPEIVPLLVAAGYLKTGDVDALGDAFPLGLDRERQRAVAAAAELARAGERSGMPPSLPDWLNAQLLLLMGEERPTEIFQQMYASKPEPQQNGTPAAGNVRPGIAERFRPNPGIGDNR